MQLTNRVKTVLCKTAVAAGTTDVTDATVIDTAGYDGVRFITTFGAITAGAVTHCAVCGLDTSSPTPGTDDLAGTRVTVADTASDKMIIIDVRRPRQRYLRPFVDRGTQNAVINGIVAELYGRSGVQPVAADATVAGQELHVSVANGTA